MRGKRQRRVRRMREERVVQDQPSGKTLDIRLHVASWRLPRYLLSTAMSGTCQTK